jgi:hypothetical protein
MDWKIDRHFDYDSINFYYVNKIASYQTENIKNLPTISLNTLTEIGEHLRTVAAKLEIDLPKCGEDHKFTWATYLGNHPLDKQYDVWKYREYVFGCAMLFIAQYIKSEDFYIKILDKPRIIPKSFNIKEHSFTIVGSSELMSDIDITIQGKHASFLISVIEDLFIYLTTYENIPLRCMDVEFYGDFHLLGSLFINFHKFSNFQRLLLLKYAIVSYYRSTQQGDIHPNVEFLIKHCLKLASVIDIDTYYIRIINDAYDFWNMTAPLGILDREYFYRELFKVESDSATIFDFLSKTSDGIVESNNVALKEKGIEVDSLAFTMFRSLALANIHRAESYVLPSTAVHVVEFEQKKVGKSDSGLPESWFASNGRVGIDNFGFILSAIEQLGYLIHYHPEEVNCSKKGIKYFGRYVRALTAAQLLHESSHFTGIYKELNAFRSSKDASAICKYDVHTLLKNIHTRLQDGISGGRRTRRRRSRPLKN